MMDDTLKGPKSDKRTKTIFPVKLKQNSTKLKSALEQGLACPVMIMHGGRDFDLRVAATESMTSAEGVKNVMNAMLRVVSLIIHASTTANNSVVEAYLSTTKSQKLSII